MSETFAFEVAYETTFKQLETLRDKMLMFLKTERRDYLPSFDVVVVGMFDLSIPIEGFFTVLTSLQIFLIKGACLSQLISNTRAIGNKGL